MLEGEGGKALDLVSFFVQSPFRHGGTDSEGQEKINENTVAYRNYIFSILSSKR